MASAAAPDSHNACPKPTIAIADAAGPTASTSQAKSGVNNVNSLCEPKAKNRSRSKTSGFRSRSACAA
jgi:hypothetical protein